MAISLRKFGIVSPKNVWRAARDPVCFCGFEKVLSVEQLMDLDDPVRLLMDCIKQLSTRQRVHRLHFLYFHCLQAPNSTSLWPGESD